MPFLDKRCLILTLDTENPTILGRTNTSLTLSLPSVTPQQLCPGITQPTPTYLVFLGQMTNNCRNSSCCLSALPQKTWVWLFWNQNARDIKHKQGMWYHFQSFYKPFCNFLSRFFSASASSEVIFLSIWHLLSGRFLSFTLCKYSSAV